MTQKGSCTKLIICFVVEYYYPHIGGGELLFQKLAEGLVKEGHRCSVITCRLPGTGRIETVNGVDIYRVRVPRWADRDWFTFFSFFKVWKIAKHADIIHTMSYNAACPAWLVARMHKKPAVITVHEVLGEKWMRLNFNFMVGFLCRLIEDTMLRLPYDGYSCNSQNTLNCLTHWGINPEKVFLAYPGVSKQLFMQKSGGMAAAVREMLGISKDTFLYLYYGRPGMVKGLEYLVRAVPLVQKKIPGSILVLILAKSPPSKYREITTLIQTLHLDNVIVYDSIPRELLPQYIQAGDCVVVPSLNEGFGFTCVEACTMGKPVVATRVGSLPEVIFGKYVLVPPYNPEALADGVVKVYQKAYETGDLKSYQWEDTVKQHVTAYSKIIADRKKNI